LAANVLSPSADQILIAANPRAGSCEHGDSIWRLAELLRQAGFTVDISQNLEKVASHASTLHAGGRLRAVLAAGGDGTVAEIANRTDPGVPIGVFPMGTANLLANYLGISSDPEQVCRIITEGVAVQLDAGRANGRLFLLMVGCGFDADVVERLHRQRSGHIRYWSYAKPIIDSIRSYQYPELRISTHSPEGMDHAIRARWAFVVNLPCYAAGLKIAPQAVGTDGLLHVCTFDKGSLWHGLRYLGHIVLRHHVCLDEFKTVTGTRVKIESDWPVPYQLDGDPGGYLPLEVEVVRDRLTVLAPAACAARLSAPLTCEAVC